MNVYFEKHFEQDLVNLYVIKDEFRKELNLVWFVVKARATSMLTEDEVKMIFISSKICC
jgi:hypothetical protein